MVAITVILAAVIAAFVLDIGDTGEPVQANIDVDVGSDNEVTLTVTDATNVDDFRLSDDADANDCFDNGLDLETEVGSTDTGDDDCEGDLIIIGEVDGSEQIVVDTTI